MKIKRLVIENFKSIERIELVEPNPFTVFVGPNGSGKSNIFEALEFFTLRTKFRDTDRLFLGEDNFLYKNRKNNTLKFEVITDFHDPESSFSQDFMSKADIAEINSKVIKNEHGETYYTAGGIISLSNYPGWFQSLDDTIDTDWKDFYNNFNRIFVNNRRLQKIPFHDDKKLSLSCDNLEQVLKRIFLNSHDKEDIVEWLQLFVPRLRDIGVITSDLSGEDTLLFFEKNYEKPFTRNLVSDGTYNILALLAAVYQSKEPQFLCIEEPENGLNPKVVKELVNLCRYACEEFGHFIWLNTHSQSLVSVLTPDEIVLVDKIEGATQIKQIKGMNLHDLPMDEAWLSNALGGGLPW